MIRLATGAMVTAAAVALQLAMVVRLIEPDALVSLAGYAGLLAGMGIALAGALSRR